MIYLVCSYGGSGSKMLTSFLQEFYETKHVHDGKPPKFLTEVGISRGKTDNTFLKTKVNPQDYKVIFIYKKPIFSRVSRGGVQACINIDGNVKKYKKDLEEFIIQGEDTMNYYNHFKNYTEESDKNYSVICINYHKLWDNLEEIFEILEIPKKEILNFPEKIETERNISSHIIEGLNKIYKNMCEEIEEMPAIKIVKNNYSL